MSRPMYEVKSDVDKERRVMDQITGKYPFAVQYQKLPIAYQLDYGVYRQSDRSLLHIFEIKSRNIHIETYPDLILSAHKMHKLIDWYVRGIKTALLYNLDCGLYAYDVTTDAYQLPLCSGGRTDRDDWQDVEPVYHIATDLLRRI